MIFSKHDTSESTINGRHSCSCTENDLATSLGQIVEDSLRIRNKLRMLSCISSSEGISRAGGHSKPTFDSSRD